MKHILLLIVLIVMGNSLRAQDLLVTNEGDSLNCKITKIRNDNIYFTFKYKGEIRNTLLPVHRVILYQYNYYQTPEVMPEQIKRTAKYPHFRIALNGGYSYRLASAPADASPDQKSYINGLKSGYNYGADLTYFFTEYLGIGFKYNTFASKNKLNNRYITYIDGSTDYGTISDNIKINFIAPFFSTRILNTSKKNCWLFDVGLGYMRYTNEVISGSKQGKLNGATMGSYWNIGYDIGISKKMAIGFQISYLSGLLAEYKETIGGTTQTIKLDRDNYEGLAHINLSIGLRYNM